METLRDVVVIIAGLLVIITILGFAIGGFVLYRKIRRTIESVKAQFRRLQRIIAVIRIMREVFKPRERKSAKAQSAKA